VIRVLPCSLNVSGIRSLMLNVFNGPGLGEDPIFRRSPVTILKSVDV